MIEDPTQSLTSLLTNPAANESQIMGIAETEMQRRAPEPGVWSVQQQKCRRCLRHRLYAHRARHQLNGGTEEEEGESDSLIADHSYSFSTPSRDGGQEVIGV